MLEAVNYKNPPPLVMKPGRIRKSGTLHFKSQFFAIGRTKTSCEANRRPTRRLGGTKTQRKRARVRKSTTPGEIVRCAVGLGVDAAPLVEGSRHLL